MLKNVNPLVVWNFLCTFALVNKKTISLINLKDMRLWL